MKRLAQLLATVVLLFGFAASAPAQRLTGVTMGPPGAAPGAGASISGPNWGAGRVYTPASSVSTPSPSGPTFHTNVEVMMPDGFQPEAASPPFNGWGYNTPASVACIYGTVTFVLGNGYCNPNDTTLNNPSPTGGSGTIAIVDAYDDPWIMGDLALFSAQFGIPFTPSQFTVVYENGTEPKYDSTGGWELEEALDVEWVHAMAPAAKIVLVEAATNGPTDLFQSVIIASNEVVCGATTCPSGGSGKGEVVLSWGEAEFSGEATYDSDLQTANVVYFAAAGDTPGVSYPCASPYVVCVGGTSYSRYPVGTPSNPSGSFSQAPFGGEVQGTWSLSGGGSSAYETIPSYQGPIASTLQTLNNSTTQTAPLVGYPVGVGISTTMRAVPDVSANGNPYTGYWVYDSFQFELLGYVPSCAASTPNCSPDVGGWLIVGGTSASNNVVAAIANLSGSFRASSTAELTYMYSNMGKFGDIIFGTGQCGPYDGYTANTGWDPCTGIGVPSSPAAF